MTEVLLMRYSSRKMSQVAKLPTLHFPVAWLTTWSIGLGRKQLFLLATLPSYFSTRLARIRDGLLKDPKGIPILAIIRLALFAAKVSEAFQHFLGHS